MNKEEQRNNGVRGFIGTMLIVVGVLGATLPNQALSKTGSQASSKPAFDDPIYVFSDTPKEKCEAVDQWIRSVFSENYPSEVKRMKFKGAGSEVGVRKLAEMFSIKHFGPIFGKAYQDLSAEENLDIFRGVNSCGLSRTSGFGFPFALREPFGRNFDRQTLYWSLKTAINDQATRDSLANSGGAVLSGIQRSTGIEVLDYVNPPATCPPSACIGLRVGAIDKSSELFAKGMRSGDVIVEVSRLFPTNSRGVSAGQPLNLEQFSARNLAQWVKAFDGISSGDEVVIRYYTVGNAEQSLLWKRLLSARMTHNPNREAGQYAEISPNHNIEEILLREENRVLSSPKETRANNVVFNVRPYSKEELSRWSPGTSKAKTAACTKFGAYPFLPELSHPADFQTKVDASVQQLAGVESDSLQGATANSASSVANARIALETVSRTLARARNEFWSALYQGRYDEELKNEYAYWLGVGKRYQTGSAGGALGVFLELATQSTSGNFDYPISPAPLRDAYQFAKYSGCSPVNSNYLPEASGGEAWLKSMTASKKLIPLASLVDYSISEPSEKTNLNLVEGVMACARARTTKGKSIEPCVSNSDLPFELVDSNILSLHTPAIGLQNAKRKIESEWESISSTLPDGCTLSSAINLMEYIHFRFSAVLREPEHLQAYSTGLFRAVCEDGDADPLGDDVHEYLAKYNAKHGSNLRWF